MPATTSSLGTYRAEGAVKRTLSTVFVSAVLLSVALAVWARISVVRSYRVHSEHLSPRVKAGDFLLVPLWSFVSAWPLRANPLVPGEVVVVQVKKRRQLAQVVGREAGKIWVSTGNHEKTEGEILISDSEIVGRVWKIWFSVERAGRPNSFVRWNRVLQSIN